MPNQPAAGETSPARFSQDFFLGIGIIVFGALLLVWGIPAQVNDAGSFGLPPSLAPKALVWVMIVCGVVLTLQHLNPVIEDNRLRVKEIMFLAICLVTSGLMLALMNHLGNLIDRPNAGFLLAAPIGLVAFTFLHSRAPLWAYAFNALIAPFVIFAFFWWGLELPLP